MNFRNVLSYRLRSFRTFALVALTFSLSACDFYSDSGRWSGELVAHDESWNDRTPCSVEVEITHFPGKLSFDNVDSYCGWRSLHWKPGKLNRRGSEIWKDGQRVGEVSADGTVRIRISDPSYSDSYPRRAQRLVITWTRIGDRLWFNLSEEDEGHAQILEGSLEKRHDS
ncbi:MAG TPA: hypothetical protein VIH99_02915 [Bdellovibrionota bacterium]|jgi:hypothetical protein